jgi:hypothetical protein
MKAGLLLLLASCTLLLAQPTIEFKNPTPPANKTRVLGQRCPGDLCLEDCIFNLTNLSVTVEANTRFFYRELSYATVRLLDSDGTELDSHIRALNGDKREFGASWTGTKAVTCDTDEKLTVRVECAEIDSATNHYVATNILTFKLVCIPCEEVTHTETGSEKTVVPHSSADQRVRMGGMVMNVSLLPQPVTVETRSANGWTTEPAVTTLLMAPGESVEIFFDVIVPAGTLDGTTDRITVTSSVADDPATRSTASSEVLIDTPLTIAIQQFSHEDGVLLGLRGRWDAEIVIEDSSDLKEWREIAQTLLRPPMEVQTVHDPQRLAPVGRFYRARYSADN